MQSKGRAASVPRLKFAAQQANGVVEPEGEADAGIYKCKPAEGSGDQQGQHPEAGCGNGHDDADSFDRFVRLIGRIEPHVAGERNEGDADHAHRPDEGIGAGVE